MATRKWKDEQSGQDKYSTEIVLQGYNSTLTMLGGGSSGGVLIGRPRSPTLRGVVERPVPVVGAVGGGGGGDPALGSGGGGDDEKRKKEAED